MANGWKDYPTDSGGDHDKWFFDRDKAPFCRYCLKEDYRPSELWQQGGEFFVNQ